MTQDSIQIFRQGSIEAFTDMPLEINWGVTDMCNYQCSYCFGQKPLDAKRFSSLSQLKSVITHAIALNRPSYSITLSGGEPTTHPHFFDLISFAHSTLRERLSNILIISNGSRQGKLYDKIAELSQKCRINMNISIHTDHADLEHIAFLASHLSKTLCINFSLMYNPVKFDFVKQIHNRLLDMRKEHPFNLSVTTLREPPAFSVPDRRYTQEHFDWQHAATAAFSKVVNDCKLPTTCWKGNYPSTLFWDLQQAGKREFVRGGDRNKYFQSGMFGFKGMYCVLGTRIIAVGHDGFCKGAQCKVAAAEKYKNIFASSPFEDENFIKIVQCTEDNCGCATNDSIPKFASKEEAEHFVRVFKMKQKRLMQEYKQQHSIVDVFDTMRVESAEVKALPTKIETLTLEMAFDTQFYLKNNPDVAQSGIAPLTHYMEFGFREGRNPAPWFDAQYYLATYPDVAMCGMNPLVHFLTYGRRENRKPNDSSLSTPTESLG